MDSKERLIKLLSMGGQMIAKLNAGLMNNDIVKIEEVIQSSSGIRKEKGRLYIEVMGIIRRGAQAQTKKMLRQFIGIADHTDFLFRYIGYLAEEIGSKIKRRLFFSKETLQDCEQIWTLTTDTLNRTIDAYNKENITSAQEVLTKEKNIDGLITQLYHRHLGRVLQGRCGIHSSTAFLGIIFFLARISYHTKMIASLMLTDKLEN